MTTIHKLEVLVLDLNQRGRTFVVGDRLPGVAFSTVMRDETRDVEWSDDHPLNKIDTQHAAYAELFKPAGEPITIYGDTELLELMISVNKALASSGLQFIDKSIAGDDHCVFVLESTVR